MALCNRDEVQPTATAIESGFAAMSAIAGKNQQVEESS
jgi:hypothetical protein